VRFTSTEVVFDQSGSGEEPFLRVPHDRLVRLDFEPEPFRPDMPAFRAEKTGHK